jgi:hypothetical protein
MTHESDTPAGGAPALRFLPARRPRIGQSSILLGSILSMSTFPALSAFAETGATIRSPAQDGADVVRKALDPAAVPSNLLMKRTIADELL